MPYTVQKLYERCRELADQVKAMTQEQYPYELVHLPPAHPYRMTSFEFFWDYRTRAWIPLEKFGTEGYNYPDFNHFLSDSLRASELLNQAKEWMVHYPSSQGTPSWVVSDLGNFSVIPDGHAPNPEDQLYVLGMHGMFMADQVSLERL